MRRFIQLLALLLMVPFGAMAEEPLYKDFQELQLRLEEANNRMILIRVIFIAALIVIIVVFQYLRLKDRRRREVEKQENERILAIAEDLRARLDDAESAAASASAEKNSMLEKIGFSVLERLCEQYYIYEGTDNLQPKLLKEAKSVIEDLRSDSGQLEKTLDVQKNNLVARFRAQFPKVKEEDVRLFTFLAAGFNSTTISTLMGKDKQNIYNKIWRLKTRISDSGVPDKDLFLRYFSK